MGNIYGAILALVLLYLCGVLLGIVPLFGFG